MTRISAATTVTTPAITDELPVAQSGSSTATNINTAQIIGFSGVAYLSAAPSATDTTIDVKSMPTGLVANASWVVIDPYTNDCEIRKITGISTLELTVAALDYNHAIDDPVIFVTEPVAPLEWFGAVADSGTTDNRVPMVRALAQCDGGGVDFAIELSPNGAYHATLDATNDRITITDSVTIRTRGSGKATWLWATDQSDFQHFGFLVQAVANGHYRFENIIVDGTTLANIATTNFDDIPQYNGFWLDPNSNYCTIVFNGVEVKKKFETAVQLSGNHSAGCKITYRDCDFRSYRTATGGATTEASGGYAAAAAREIAAYNCYFEGHLGEGNSTWDNRGRVWYYHPNYSVHMENCRLRGSGSTRPMLASYSSSAVWWNSAPPLYQRYIGVTIKRESGDPSTEGVQTTNLVGVTTKYIGCTIDVDEDSRIRGNTIFENCTFAGSTKSISFEQNPPLKTYLSAAASSGAGTIDVQDATIFSDTETIRIWTDDGTFHQTTVNGAPSGSTITLTDALDDDAAINSWVIHTITQTQSNATTADWIKFLGCNFQNDPNPDAMVVNDLRGEIYVDNCVVDLDLQDQNAGFYQDIKGGKLYSRGNQFRSIGVNLGNVAELDHASAEAHFQGDAFLGTWAANQVMLLANASDVTFHNLRSWANTSNAGGNAFCNGALAAQTLHGANNNFWGSAKPRCTNAQNLAPAVGMNPDDVTRAGTTVLDQNYDIHRISGTGNIVNLLHENDATEDANLSGRVTLVAIDGFTIVNGARLEMPGAANLTLAADEAVTLIFDSENGNVIGVTN